MSAWPANEFGPNLPFDDVAATVAALGIGDGDRVLDVGGASNAFERADVICDLTFGQTGQRNGAPGVFTKGKRYVEAPVERLPFADHEFDFVICRQVLEHVVDPVKAGAELARVARRGLIEVPSRAGELVNGNPTHRWIVDREGDVLVFHRRTFVEHPFDNLFYGLLFQDASLRNRSETTYRNLFNHQLAFEGRILIQVVETSTPWFDYDDPLQAARSHFSFARNCLVRGADPTYALSDAHLAVRLLPDDPRARVLLAHYQLRLLQLDEALRTLEGLDDHASASIRRLVERARNGESLDLRGLPVPDPLDPKIAQSAHNDRPKVSIVVPASERAGLREAVESALAQDYPDVEVVVATSLDEGAVAAEIGHLTDVARLVVVRVPSGHPASLLNAGLSRSTGNVLGFVIPPDRLQVHHLDRIVAVALASGADGAYGDGMLLDGGGVIAARLDPGNLASQAFSLSTLVIRSAVAVSLGPLDAGAEHPVALWLGALSRRYEVVPAGAVTVDRTAPLQGAHALDAAMAQQELRPLDLYCQVVALHAREEALKKRVRELEEGGARPSRS